MGYGINVRLIMKLIRINVKIYKGYNFIILLIPEDRLMTNFFCKFLAFENIFIFILTK